MRIDVLIDTMSFTYPDDFELSPEIWVNLQAKIIAELQEACDAGRIHPAIRGVNGDPAFRNAIDQYCRKHKES